jgi:hypothetical protein
VDYLLTLAWTLVWAVPGVSVLITGMVLLAKRRHRLPARTVRFGHAGFLVLIATTLVGAMIQVASVYLLLMDRTQSDRVAAFGVANMVSSLVLIVGNVVGMALLVTALVARSTPNPFDPQAGRFEPAPDIPRYDG